MAQVHLRRADDPPAAEDGRRVLVDRLWPRGLTKAAVAIDTWEKDVAPSSELRRWFGHDPARWEEFVHRYRQELAARPEALQPLLDAAARDTLHNEAVVLKQVIEEELAQTSQPADPGGRRLEKA